MASGRNIGCSTEKLGVALRPKRLARGDVQFSPLPYAWSG
jgi:hypothetical protein